MGIGRKEGRNGYWTSPPIMVDEYPLPLSQFSPYYFIAAAVILFVFPGD
jgi:hypothetical protein